MSSNSSPDGTGKRLSFDSNRTLAVVAPTAYLLGGVQVWLDYLVPGLEAAGWKVTLLLVHGDHSDAHRYLKQHPFSQFHLVVNASGSREGRIRALQNAIRLSGANLVLGVNIVDVYEAVTRLRGRDGNPKVAMALHGLNPCFYEDIASWHQSMDAVIATNRLAAAAAVHFGGLSEDRVYYAPCGVVVPEALMPEVSTSKLMLLYAGRFSSAEKRILDLPPILHALERRYVPYHLRLAGSGPDEDKLRTALAEFGQKVEFVGELTASVLRDSFFCPGAVALVLSPSETGPLVAWEALANGVALVTSEFFGIGLEGSLRDGENCVTFPVGDTESAAAAIARLVSPDLRRSLVKCGYELVKQRYSREASIRAWNQALLRTLAQPPLTDQPIPIETPTCGRLDRYLGPKIAESVRRLVGLKFHHSTSGGEWPHSYGSDRNEHFQRELSVIDQAEV